MLISVVGTHAWSLAPERGTVQVLVDLEGPDRVATSRAATAVVDALAGDLARLGAGPDAPVTWSSIGPLATRTWRPTNQRGEPLPPRYGASARVQATFRDVAALAEATGGWAEQEGVQITHVEWTLTDATRAEVEAASLTRAVEQAQARALAIARAAGWAEVEVEEVADPGLLGGPAGPGPQPLLERAAFRADAARGAALSPEDVRGEATVHARFRAVG